MLKLLRTTLGNQTEHSLLVTLPAHILKQLQTDDNGYIDYNSFLSIIVDYCMQNPPANASDQKIDWQDMIFNPNRVVKK